MLPRPTETAPPLLYWARLPTVPLVMPLNFNRLLSTHSPLWAQPSRLWRLSLLWGAALVGVAFLWQLGSIGLVDETEPLFAEAARQMNVTGDWVTPYFNGETRFDKPPLIYWLMAMSYQILGVNEWAVRLPSAVSAIALLALGFYTLHRFGYPQPTQTADRARWWSAWIGTTIMALTPETIVWGRLGVSDMLLSSCIGMALLSFFIAYAQPKHPQRQRRWYLASFGLSALAVLAKGPVGVVLPILIIGGFLLYVGRLRAILQEMPLLLGTGLFVLMTVPWYVLVLMANGQAYVDSFFGYHNVERFTQVVNNHSAPWYFYFVVVLVGFIPWSLWLPLAIARLRFWHLGHWRMQDRDRHLGLFALVWFWTIFVFFTVAVTKLPSYVLPLMPAAAILVGLMSSEAMRRRGAMAPTHSSGPQWVWGLTLIVHVVVLSGLAWAWFYSPNWMGNDPDMVDLPQVVRQSGVMVTAALLWGSAALISLLLAGLRQVRWVWGVNTVLMVGFVLLTLLPTLQIVDQLRQAPLREIAIALPAQRRPTEPIVQVGIKPSLVFYTQQPVTSFNSIDVVSEHVDHQLQEPATPSVLVVGLQSRLQHLQIPEEQLESLMTAGRYRLVRVKAR